MNPRLNATSPRPPRDCVSYGDLPAIWKFWLASDFLASLAAAAQQSLEPFRRLRQNFFINFKQFLELSIFHYRDYVDAERNPEGGGAVTDSYE